MDGINLPLLDGLKVLSLEKRAAFYAPGHKGGRGSIAELKNLVGSDCLRADLPELPELDNLFAPEGIIGEAQELAAKLFGADHTWFVTNGSTAGILASLLAVGSGSKQAKVILPRNAHRSLMSALILSGATPIFINPPVVNNVACGLTVERISRVLAKEKDVKALMLLSPTYEGICPDIKGIVAVAHQYGVPVIVDSAHGAHLGFHPDLPPSALTEGADVVVQSTHKTLGALTQAAMVHLRGDLVSMDRISNCLALVQSTSPNYLLLASLDGARGQMESMGTELMAKTIALATKSKQAIADIEHLSVLELGKGTGVNYLDPTRLTVFTDGLSIDGFEVDEILHGEMGVTCELPMWNYLTFIISLGNTEEDIDCLIEAWEKIAIAYGDGQSSKDRTINLSIYNIEPQLAMTPREAFFMESKGVLLHKAKDLICGETICPYPPGIPVLMPGEIITQEMIDYLVMLNRSGAVITGAKDPTLETVQVVGIS